MPGTLMTVPSGLASRSLAYGSCGSIRYDACIDRKVHITSFLQGWIGLDHPEGNRVGCPRKLQAVSLKHSKIGNLSFSIFWRVINMGNHIFLLPWYPGNSGNLILQHFPGSWKYL